MRALSTPELLEAWERGLSRSQLERALLLLSAATGASPKALAHLSIGERDAHLLELREQTFGPQLTSLAQCPACGERLEMTFNVADLRAVEKQGDAQQGTDERASQEISVKETRASETHALAVGVYEISFRLPDSFDLLALAHCSDAQAARQTLLARCLLKAQREAEDVAVEELPPDVLTRVVERMADLDPQADVRLALNCARCSKSWEEIFDINSFFWTEINAWAKRTLSDVHTLAKAYGWRERDILELSAWRRDFYLSMARG